MLEKLEDEAFFEATLIALIAFAASGVILDMLDHIYGAPISFFKWQHLIIYSGLTGVLLLIAYPLTKGFIRDGEFLPQYGRQTSYSAIGVIVGILGGLGDMLWHETFGLEQGLVEVATSPTHLLIGLGLLILASGPLRRKIAERRKHGSRKEKLSLFISSILTLTLIHLFLFYSNPLIYNIASSVSSKGFVLAGVGVGVTGILLYSLILTTFLLFLIKNIEVPKGLLVAVTAVNGFLLALLGKNFYLVPGIFIAGLYAEITYRKIIDTGFTITKIKAFSTIFPIILLSTFFASTSIVHGITWRIHIWPGVILLSAIAGLLISYGFFPTERQTLKEK